MAEVTHKLIFSPLYSEQANKVISISSSSEDPKDIDVAAIADSQLDPAEHNSVDWYIIDVKTNKVVRTSGAELDPI